MLTISKISSEGSGYYGKDNYYTMGEEEAGQWFGKGAQQLGLAGAVDNDKFDTMLKGNFGSGIELGRTEKGENIHHPGWDHTFSAPKSVSMLALVAKDERLVKAHDKAVNYALHYIEDKLAESRFRVGHEIESRKTGNIIVAKFRHDISRAKDPQLHTHSTILNATFGGNGLLRSLDSPVFYEHKMLMGAMYQSMLSSLVQEIGYKVEIQDNGTFHISGVNKELIDQASKRRADIVEMQKEQGTSGAIAAQYAALATRPEKEALSYQEKQDLWRHDFGDKAINKMVVFSKKAVKQLPLTQEQIKEQELYAIKAVDSAVRHLSENEAVFKTIDIAREAIVTSLGKAMPHQIKQAIDDKIKRSELLHAKATEIKILNNSPKIINKRAYTTPELIEQEKLTLKIMREGRLAIKPIADKNLSLNRGDIFTKGQAAAAIEILTTKDRFINIQGLAGTGKTFMLKEIKEQADNLNIKVIGMAPSNAAANLLKDGIGIESKTVQKHLIEGLQYLNKNPTSKKSDQKPKQRELWLIDESSFISTKQALAITKLATKVNAQVVNLGDKKQLAGVEAGKPFAISQQSKYGLKTIEMNEIIRQTNTELKQAIYSATSGDIKGSFAKINKNIIQVQNKDGVDEPILRREIMANTYLSMDEKDRNNTLVISPANEDRFDVNNHIREGLKEEGSLGKKFIKTTNLVNKNLTNEAKTKSYNYYEGHIVRFNRSYKKLGIEKNDYLEVANINNDKNQITLIDKHKKTIAWNPKEIASKNVEVYFENKRELREGEVLFWRRTKNTGNDKRNTNEKIKILSVNRFTKNVKYVDLSTGESQSMNIKDFKNKHWEYAYCLTAHQAQGQTSEKVMINLESWRGKLSNQQAFYVEISRAKEEAIVFTDDKDKIRRQLITKTGEKESAFEQVSDKRSSHLEDILAKQRGMKTSDELYQERQQELQAKTEKYIKSLSVNAMKNLEKDFRQTLSKTMLKVFDKAENGSKMNGVYNGLIILHAQETRIEPQENRLKAQEQTQDIVQKQPNPIEVER
ncbi:hypothetical protein MS2017_1366 [Bathymodiolus thermophilus thioautotrophic gill symbiont]|uniref:TrwC relaxase domain-containing protein n=1 Tax=Bathymodiolus thermophilus thioautotrophic gill symbiont TaxID=2360 RepID=A0A3G3INA1_9GAMM|nr:MobF family relaxase [Bathymodiolus thermophilus thioautotrophic gill symbiont]AYQ57054.1 hypothetical protein MS2017_1366 [Bathymodiolus thermophilus thioautotrophic gill symbiont]